MKNRILIGKRFVFAVLLVSFTACVCNLGQRPRAAAQQCVNAPANLVSWYRGEGSTGDASGANNGGAVGGVAYAPGRNGQGFIFNGTGEVVIPDAGNLNPQTITLEVWVYPTALDGNFELIAAKETEPSGTYHYEIAIKGPAGGSGKIPVGNLAFAINGIIGLPDDYLSWVDGGGAVPLNTWTHVAMTFDGTTAKTFINGKATRTLTGLRGKLPATSGSLRLGSRSPAVISKAPKDRFNGRIDEFSIYDRALTPGEIETIVSTADVGRCYNSAPMVTAERGVSLVRQQGSPAAKATLATVSDEQTAAGNLVVKIENVPAGLSISNLTNTNGAITAMIAANCNAVVGANNVALQVSDGKLITSVTLTVNVTANVAPLLGTYANTTAAFEKGATITPSAAPNDNGIITNLSVTGVTGATINAATGVITIPATTPLGTYSVTIKATDNCGAATTRTLTLTVNQVCSPAPTGLAAWYRAENNANDVIGANHGRLQNGATFAPGKVGQAFSFDGVNDAITLNTTVGNFGTADFTLGFWMRTTATRMEAVLNKRAICDHSSFWDLRTINGQLLLELDQTSGTTYNLLKSDKIVNDGNFHHVMIARTGVTLRLYLDGVLERSQIRASQTNVTNTANLMIGTDVCVNIDKTKPFTGQLDELEIYSRALTAADALEIFKAGRLGRCVVPQIASAALASKASITLETLNDIASAPPLLISAFRLSGPGGANDWYVELFNRSAAPIPTTGLTLGLANQTGDQVLSFVLKPDQVIASYGTYLIAGSAYSLSVTATRANGVLPDQQQAALPFENAAAVALFAGLPHAANRIDSAGVDSFSGGTNAYFLEGAPLPFLNATTAEHAFVRRLFAPVQPQDTQDNRADFVLVTASGKAINGQTPVVGKIAPRNSVTPLPRR